MKIMVSACLLGENCKYSGGNNLRPELLRLLAGHTVIPVCPEILGGLPTPRIPAEIVNGTVINREGQSVDAAFRLGAEKALETALREKPDLIILQSRSPSCGVREVYDGTFSGKKIPGRGIFAELAVRAGFRVMDAEDILTDFSAVTACGECCTECPKKKDGRCPGCIEADGRVPEWAESGRCKIHACTREHHVRFCGLCGEFPCGRLPSLAHWNPGIVERMTALRDAVLEVGKMKQGSPLNDSAAVHQQYSTPDRLNTRISIHSKYSVNRQGFGNWITSHYRIQEGMSVLELGCGTGEMWAGNSGLIRRCSRFVLSDLSEGMLEKAKETLRGSGNIEYRVIDIQEIPFPDRQFDVVIANMMLYHVPDLSGGLREVRRVLKSGGTFYCATYGENGIMEYICGLFPDERTGNSFNHHFTLQNGGQILRSVFPEVRQLLYRDALEVTDVEDLVDYIFSLTGMTALKNLPRQTVRDVLEKNMRDGVLHIPKEYGMFIAR